MPSTAARSRETSSPRCASPRNRPARQAGPDGYRAREAPPAVLPSTAHAHLRHAAAFLRHVAIAQVRRWACWPGATWPPRRPFRHPGAWSLHPGHAPDQPPSASRLPPTHNRYVADPDFATVDSAALCSTPITCAAVPPDRHPGIGRTEAGRAAATGHDHEPTTAARAALDHESRGRRFRPCARHDQLIRERLRRADHGARPAQQPTHRFLLRCRGEQRASGQPRTGRQATALLDGAAAGVRARRRRLRDGARFAGRRGHHCLRGRSLIGVLDWQLDLQRSIALPNSARATGRPNWAGRASEALQRALHERGHEIRIQPLTSGAQGIQRTRAAAGSYRRIHATRGRGGRRLTRFNPPMDPQLSPP